MQHRIIAVLALVVALAAGTHAATAQEEPSPPTTATVEVTVWRSLATQANLYLSTRPEGGRWRTLNTPLDMSMRSASGRFHQSNAVRVAVPLPDLVVDTPTVSASSPMAGQSFALSVTVRNRGTGAAGQATLIYYRSDDATLTSGDTEVGRDWISGLEASSGTSEESLRTQAPTTPGAYYYGACVDAVAGEFDPTNNCSAVVVVPVSEFNIENLPWVADGVTSNERRAMDRIRSLARVDPSMFQRVAGAPWLADGVTADDLSIINSLEILADSHPEIAVPLTTVPDRTGHLIGAVLRSVQWMLASDPSRSEHLQQQSWFRDGLTEEEAALIVVLPNIPPASIPHAEDVFQDLLRGAQVRSETIALPLAGAVNLYAVGRSRLALAGQLERMRFAAESMEAFMGTPWPKPATIALVELGSDLGSDPPLGRNAGDSVVVGNTSKYLTYHELAHFYFGAGAPVPRWLSEGAADFLTLYTLRLTGDIGSVRALYARDQVLIAEECLPDGATNVQGWIENEAERLDCPYLLGRQLLAGMYRALGHAVVSAALRELFETGQRTGRAATEDEIYQAFLTHTPQPQHEAFRFWYSCLHGRPIPGYTPAPRAPVSPQIRDVLAALYHATNGPGWRNSENWLSDAPLDQWHGVGVDCDGSITGLSLSENQLRGPIPPALGRLATLTLLDLERNQLTGQIPVELGSLANLIRLNLLGNQLSGPIPPELGNLANLQSLDLTANQLRGPIPSELGGLANLAWLYLVGNQLRGPIPPELGGLVNLQLADLALNQLSGTIPSELGNLANLRWLSLFGNQLRGPIPPALGSLANLTALTLSDNQLSGPIPPALGSLANLTALYLSGNQLSGPIPPALGRLANLRWLGLSENQLTGCVPQGLVAVENNDIDSLSLAICADA